MHNQSRDTPGSERRKGNKERTKGARRPTGLDGDSHLGRTNNTGSDQMSSGKLFQGRLTELLRYSPKHKLIILICARR